MRIESGIDGLDEIIQGGLLPERVYLLSGPQAVARPPLVCSSLRKAHFRVMLDYMSPYLNAPRTS